MQQNGLNYLLIHEERSFYNIESASSNKMKKYRIVFVAAGDKARCHVSDQVVKQRKIQSLWYVLDLESQKIHY